MKTTAVQSFHFLAAENKRLPRPLEPRPHLSVRSGDVLITRAGPRKRVGITCLVRETQPRLMVCDKVYRLRCDKEKTLPACLEVVLNAPRIVDALDELKTGISDSGVNLTQQKFMDLRIPIPTIENQSSIVVEVERHLSIVHEIEAQIDANLMRAARLRQGILKRAFEGRLVPQDPNDEPAEKLLERIRQQRQPATKMYNGRLGSRRARRPRRTSDPLLPFPQDDGNGQGGKP